MKLLLCLFLAVLVPALCRGESVSLADSTDWRPLPDAQKATLLKKFSQPGVRLLDASLYTGGSGAGVFASTPLGGTVDKTRFDGEVESFIKGGSGIGITLLDRQPINVASLPGVFATFQGQANGKVAYILAYALFTDHVIYGITLYTPKLLSRTDPMVASYEARIRLDPSTVPANVDKPARIKLTPSTVPANVDKPIRLPLPVPSGLNSYQLGRLTGAGMVVLLVAAVLVALIIKFVPGR